MKCLVRMIYKSILIEDHSHEIEVLFENKNGVPEIYFISHVN